MKKTVLFFVTLIALFLSPIPKKAFAEEEPADKLTCDQVWEIVGTDDCPDWVVSNMYGNVWCNVPPSREGLQPWIYGPAPTYSFEPGTCPVEEDSPPQEKLSQTQTKQKDVDPYKNTKDMWPPVFISDWFKYVAAALELSTLHMSKKGEQFSERDRKWLAEIKKDSKMGKEEIREQITRWNEYKKEKEAWENATFHALITEGVEYREPGSSEFTTLTTKHIISNGGILQTNKPIYIRTNTALFWLKPYSEWRPEPGIVEFQNGTVILKQGMLTVEEEKRPDGKFIRLKTPRLEIIPRGTQVAVVYDNKSDKSVIIVHEGEARVIVENGQTATISPSGDEPGVVIVSQKISVMKLVPLGLILIAAIGGIVIFLRRKKKK